MYGWANNTKIQFQKLDCGCRLDSFASKQGQMAGCEHYSEIFGFHKGWNFLFTQAIIIFSRTVVDGVSWNYISVECRSNQ
jgi:hypothetical protein